MFSVCEDKKEAAFNGLEKQFLKDYFSTTTVDKFFLFDCQKDMRNGKIWSALEMCCGTSQYIRILFLQLLHGESVCSNGHCR